MYLIPEEERQREEQYQRSIAALKQKGELLDMLAGYFTVRELLALREWDPWSTVGAARIARMYAEKIG